MAEEVRLDPKPRNIWSKWPEWSQIVIKHAYAGSLASIEDILGEASNGRMFILVDDAARQGEAHLVIPAQFATPDRINFMARFGRGLICLALTPQRVDALELSAMSVWHPSRHDTAFTVSIEAKAGVSTGISAADRAATIQVAIDGGKGAADLVSPGHVFPLRARDGGVLVCAGHAEAAVDIARLSGLNASGVICQIIGDDGATVGRAQLDDYARLHGLKIGTIGDLIAYRRIRERLVDCIARERFVSDHGGEWQLRVYRHRLGGSEHLALVKGHPVPGAPTLVRMHAFSMYDDILGGAGGRARLIPTALDMIGREGRGVFVLIRNFGTINYTEMLESTRKQAAPIAGHALREYGVGAEILLELGISRIELLTDAHHQAPFIGLDGYGLEIVAVRPLPLSPAGVLDPAA